MSDYVSDSESWVSDVESDVESSPEIDWYNLGYGAGFDDRWHGRAFQSASTPARDVIESGIELSADGALWFNGYCAGYVAAGELVLR